MGKILLYGYYGFKNFGDDLFEHSFQKLLKTLTDHDIITVYKRNFKDAPLVDYIFLGGGEIINEFFMYNLFEYIDRHRMYYVPIFGASIGFDKRENGPIEFCDFFDKCIFRNNIERIIDDKHFFYDHDILMYPQTAETKIFLQNQKKLKSSVLVKKKKKVKER